MPFAVLRDGTALFYVLAGNGHPLLLMPGQAQDHRGWDGIWEDFAGEFTVIRFDPRGTGQSDKPSEPAYSTRLFADDAANLLDVLGVRHSHVYGYSMGGRVAQWLAIDHADRVSGLVLGCTTPGNAHGVPRPPEVQALFQHLAQDPRSLSVMLDSLLTPAWQAAHPAYMDALAQRPPVPAYVQKFHLAASEAHDAWDRLTDITSPTLIIHGDDDMVNVAANARLLADRIPGARMHVIETARHFYFVEFRESASRLVIDFLRGVVP